MIKKKHKFRSNFELQFAAYLDKKKTKDGILISPEAFISLAIMEKLERQQGKH